MPSRIRTATSSPTHVTICNADACEDLRCTATGRHALARHARRHAKGVASTRGTRTYGYLKNCSVDRKKVLKLPVTHLTGVCHEAGPHATRECVHDRDQGGHGGPQPPLLRMLHARRWVLRILVFLAKLQTPATLRTSRCPLNATSSTLLLLLLT
jgi:hypothetical protein